MVENRRVIELQTKVVGAAELKRLSKAYAVTDAAATKAQKAVKQGQQVYQGSTRKIANMGHVASNAGYQIQDFAVQVQGGVSAMKAASQQIPQMLIGFGAWGSAIGVVIALLPTLVTIMKQVNEETVDMEQAFKDLQKSMDKVNTDEFVRKFDEATESQRRLLVATAQVTVTELTQDLAKVGAAAVQAADDYDKFAEAQETYASAAEKAAASAQGMNFIFQAGQENFATDRVEEYSNSLGITAEQMAQISPLVRQVAEEQYKNADSLAALIEQLNAFGKEEISDEMSEYIQKLVDANKAVIELAKAEEMLAKGRENITTGAPIGDNDTGGGDPIDLRSNRPTFDRRGQEWIDIRNGMRDLDQMAKEYYETQKLNAQEWQKQVDLFREYNPEAARAYEEMARHKEALDANVISEQRYQEEMAKSRELLNGQSEQYSYLADASRMFADGMRNMFDGLVDGTEDVSESFKRMAKQIIAEMARIAAIRGIASMFAGAGYGGTSDALLGTLAKGGVVDGGNITPFARGGIVNSPTIFPLANGAGLMGEAGPEAIMPLGRNSKGELGVKGGATNVTVNNMAPGVEVRPRNGDDGLTIDVVMDSVANAIERGGNRLSNSFEKTFALGRGRGVY